MQLLALAASILGIEVDELLDRVKRNAMAWSVVALLAFVGLIFLLMALNAWLTSEWGPVTAPLVIGGVAIAGAAAIWSGIAIAESMARREAARRRNSTEKTALVTTAALTALPLVMRSDLMKKVGIPIGGALAAAYLLGKPTGQHGPNGHANGHDVD